MGRRRTKGRDSAVKMSSAWKRLGPLAAAVFLLIGAGIQLRIAGGDTSSANSSFAVMLVAAGFVVLGSWLTVEVWHHHDTNRQPLGLVDEVTVVTKEVPEIEPESEDRA
jgi:hypothetical protein